MENNTEAYSNGYLIGYKQAEVDCGKITQEEADKVAEKINEERS